MTSTDDPPPATDHVFAARLDDEWRQLKTLRRSLEMARQWARDNDAGSLEPVLRHLTDLDQILAATHGKRGERGHDDEVLLRLVEIAKHDQLAGRIVIQRLLPGLIARGAGYRNFYDGVDPAELVVPAAWLAIRSYDVDVRRRHVAPSLISDATFAAFRKPLRRLPTNEDLRPPQWFVYTPALDEDDTAIVQLADIVRAAEAAGAPAYDLELIRHLARAPSPGIVAQERHVTPRTIRNHRDRALDNLRRVLAIAA